MKKEKCKLLKWKDGLEWIKESKAKAPGIKDDLYTLLSSLEHSKHDTKDYFIETDYAYGEKLFSHGEFNLPNDIAISSQLNYSTIPLGLVLARSVEVNTVIEEWRVSVTIIPKGEMFGVFETLDYLCSNATKSQKTGATQVSSWEVTSGASSIRINAPIKVVTNKNNVFEACRSLTSNSSWSCKVLYFTSNVFEKINKSSNTIKEFLFRYGWQQNQVALKFNTVHDNALAPLAVACNSARGQLPAPFFGLFVKLLLALEGSRPAYRPVTDTNIYEELGPFVEIKNGLSKNQKLKERDIMLFVPSFVHGDLTSPAYLSLCDASPGFHASKLPGRNHQQEFENLLKMPSWKSHPLLSLCKEYNVTSFQFLGVRRPPNATEKVRQQNTTTEQKSQSPMQPYYQSFYDPDTTIRRSWTDSYLQTIKNPYDKEPFFRYLVGIHKHSGK